MNKFIYIANIRIPTEKAHGIQIMEMCSAFGDLGLDVELVVPKRRDPIGKDPFDYHDIKENFKIKKLWCIDATRFYRPGFLIQTVTFIESVLLYSLLKDALFYTRDESIALLLNAFGKKVVWEGHMGQTNWIIRIMIRLDAKMVVITEGLKKLYMDLGAREGNILVASDGADLSRFDIDLSKEEARKKLGLPHDKKIILYKGSLGAWKGADTLAEAASLLKSGAEVVFIGGTAEDIEVFRTRFANIPNVRILGNKPRQETPIYQKAADILVIPNSAKEDISKLYTSPMKLFGYMAANRPIVASNLSSIREVLDESLAYFFTPDDPLSLAETIDMSLDKYEEAQSKAQAALSLSKNYSWQSRAQKIIDFAKKIQ